MIVIITTRDFTISTFNNPRNRWSIMTFERPVSAPPPPPPPPPDILEESSLLNDLHEIMQVPILTISLFVLDS